jgi:hypothetical protein
MNSRVLYSYSTRDYINDQSWLLLLDALQNFTMAIQLAAVASSAAAQQWSCPGQRHSLDSAASAPQSYVRTYARILLCLQYTRTARHAVPSHTECAARLVVCVRTFEVTPFLDRFSCWPRRFSVGAFPFLTLRRSNCKPKLLVLSLFLIEGYQPLLPHLIHVSLLCSQL